MTEAAAPKPSEERDGGPRLALPARLLSDERLARRAAKSDPAAFEAIYRRYHQDLYRFCLATTGNVQDAQDALQNTMVKVMRALPGERREIKLKPWLYRIARNESVETLRRRRDGAELEPEQMAASWEIAETAAARERLRGLLSDLEELPERQRAALLMRELAGLEYAEIGDTFGTSAAVARQTLYEARLSLRQMEEGREMSCETVMQALSDADGRITRRRDVRAHLRSCERCRSFRDGIAARQENLAAIAPLPLAASVGLLQALLGGAAGAGAGGASGAAGAIGAGAAKVAAASTVAKSAATVAVVATVGVSADRSGVIDLPLPGNEGRSAKSVPGPSRSSPPPSPSSPAANETPGTAQGAASSRAAKGPGGKAAKTAGGRGAPRHAAGKPRRAGKPQRASGGGAAKHSRPRPNRGRPGAGRQGRPQAPPSPSRGPQGSKAPKQTPSSQPPPQSGAAGGKAKTSPEAAPPPKSEGAIAPPSPPGRSSPGSGEAAEGESALGGGPAVKGAEAERPGAPAP